MAEASLVCPGCGESMIEVADVEATLDVCGACQGLWFDRGELGQKKAKLPSDLVAVGESERSCPRCGVALTLCNSAVVELDRCDTCGGLYLDAGELELLLAVHKPHAGDRALPPVPRFRCDFCHQLHLMVDQVIGENATACSACAKRLEVRHDPARRRERELARREAGDMDGLGVDPASDRWAFNRDRPTGRDDLLSMLLNLFS